MNTVVQESADARLDVRARRSFGRLAVFAAAYTYALIVVGGVVRISGSGLGCGDDWPRCHGSWIPPMTVSTLIEYLHRLLAAGVVFVVGAVLVQALRGRFAKGVRHPYYRRPPVSGSPRVSAGCRRSCG